MSLATVHPPEPAPAVPRSVPILESEAKAVAVARQLAAEFANEATQRDRARRLPHIELDRFSGSGLWAISVPKEYGGLGASIVTITEIFKVISAADSSIGQIPHNHFCVVDAIRLDGTDSQKEFYFGQVLDGHRFGNAFSEAQTAIEETIRFVRERSRPWIDSKVERAADDPLTISQIGDLEVRLHAAEAVLERAARILDAGGDTPDDKEVALAAVAVAEAKILTTEIAILAANKLFELAGTQSTLEKYALDRLWRNARTHTLHDPVRWKYHAIGNFYLNEVLPPRHPWN
jgi:alkylation response protein AidB-like acyl-CoA dehydrogenase